MGNNIIKITNSTARPLLYLNLMHSCLGDNAYPNFHDMLSISQRMREGLVPPWIQVFINHLAFVELFSF